MKNEEKGEYIAIDPAVNGITRVAIGCAYTVSNSLGCGFLEKVYESALVHELTKKGLRVNRQHTIKVQYDGIVVGDYIADLVVEDRVLVEIKTVDCLASVHVAQCLNYLKATGIRVGLLMNFGAPRVETKRS